MKVDQHSFSQELWILLNLQKFTWAAALYYLSIQVEQLFNILRRLAIKLGYNDLFVDFYWKEVFHGMTALRSFNDAVVAIACFCSSHPGRKLCEVYALAALALQRLLYLQL